MSDDYARRSESVRDPPGMPGAFTPPIENLRASGLGLNPTNAPPFGGSSVSSTLRNRSTAGSASSFSAPTIGYTIGNLAGPPAPHIEVAPKAEELAQSPTSRRDGSVTSSWDSLEDDSDDVHPSTKSDVNTSREEAPSSTAQPGQAPEPPREQVETPLNEERHPEPPANAPPEAPIDEPQCRICLGGAEDSDELGPLIRPCRCTGTISFVHVQCLNSWRTRSGVRSAFWQCPQCHFKYAFVRTRILGLGESKAARVSMTAVLFIFLVFVASSVVQFFFPDILSPEGRKLPQRALEDDMYLGYSGFGYGFGLGGWNFMLYDWSALPGIVSDMVRLAAATFLDVELDIGQLFGWTGRSTSSASKRRGAARGRTGATKYATGRGPGRRVRTDGQGNVLDSVAKSSWIGRLVARFMLGLSTLGIVSFLQLMMSMSMLAPLQIARGTWFRRRRRDGNGGAGEGTAAIVIAVFVAIGVARALWQVYKMTAYLARYLLTRAETAILDVDGNPHYARPIPPQPNPNPNPAAQQAEENLTLRERAVRWLAQRAVALDPRQFMQGQGLGQPVRVHQD